MYVATGMYSSKHLLRLLLSECPAVQAAMGAASSQEAMTKIETDAPMFDPGDGTTIVLPPFQYPRILIDSPAFQMETVGYEGSIMGNMDRSLNVAIGMYVPEGIPGVYLPSDEVAWVDDQIGQMVLEIMQLQGRGTSIAGQTHIEVKDPTYHWSTCDPPDERDDDQDSEPERPRYLAVLNFESP